MLKSKYAFSAFCMLVAMTMATGAFAQNILSVSSGVEPRGREHGQTEPAGGITLRVEDMGNTSGEALATGTLTIDYTATITNPATGDDAIAITGDGCFGTDDLGDPVVDGSILTIPIGKPDMNDGACANGDEIDVSGVLLALAGTGLAEVPASISISGDFRLERSRVTVINTVVDELNDEDVTTVFEVGDKDVDHKLTLLRHTGEVAAGKSAKFVLKITENTVDSFDGAELVVHFSGIPEGFSIALDAWVSDTEREPELAVVVTQEEITADDDLTD